MEGKSMAKDKRQARIDELESELQKLGETRHLRSEQITTLEIEQRQYIIGARIRKNAEAQASIDRLSIEIAKLRTEDVWDSAAIEEISTKLADEKAALHRDQWQARCETVNRLVKSRSKGELEQRLLDLALQLRSTAAEIADSDAQIVSALGSLHPSLARDVQEFPYRESWRRGAISYLLRGVVETPVCREPMYTSRMQDLAVAAFDLVRNHIDEAAEMEPAAEAA
jgi:hypothetical protein